LPTYTYDGKKGKSNTDKKRKIMHPSKTGPLPKDVYKKKNPKTPPKGYRKN